MPRLAAYAATSATLAAAVVLRAFHERPNFYSACVYLSQSNACLMILTNFILMCVSGILYGLQRLLYGPLRPIEIEQLYEKGWFAVTETCLAMTTFREEVGAWFMAMFVSLLVGKVWGWIGEGRIEFLEQQPPANPRLFHTRLALSLAISLTYSVSMMMYCTNIVLDEARPGMMVMFAFDFAVLSIGAISSLLRYTIALIEASVIKKQIQERLEARRAEIRAQRAQSEQHSTTDGSEQVPEQTLLEEDIDEADIDAPGWEDKGRWVFVLDLVTDFTKIVIYVIFFSVLSVFHGLPIYILRDLVMSGHSLARRLRDFARYRKATRDMNTRYPDATAEELAGENTCIICREEMRLWQQPNAQAGPGNDARATAPPDERLRPKKLPCGHILHFNCLRSWLERQQACPTCRRPVLSSSTTIPTAQTNAGNAPAANAVNQPVQAQGQHHNAAQNQQNAQQGAPNQARGRVFNLGPLRVAFGAGPAQQVHELLQRLQNGQPAPPVQQQPPPQRPLTDEAHLAQRIALGRSSALAQLQLMQIERQINREIQELNAAQNQLGMVRALQGELARLRTLQSQPQAAHPTNAPQPHVGHIQAPQPMLHNAPFPLYGPPPTFVPQPQLDLSSAGHNPLPEGLTLPPGWTMVPLQRVSQAGLAGAYPAAPQQPAAAANSSSPDPGPSGANTGAIGYMPSQPQDAQAQASPVNGQPVISAGSSTVPRQPTPSSSLDRSRMSSIAMPLRPGDAEAGGTSDPSPSTSTPASSPSDGKMPSFSAGGTWDFGGNVGSAQPSNAAGESSSSAGKARAATVEDADD